MHTTIDWTDPINWLIAATLLVLLIGQGWFIFRNRSLGNSRKWLRAGLNLLLWLAVTGYFLQIRWATARPASHVLLVANNVPAAFARRVQDSLNIRALFTSQHVKPDYDSVTLVGQHFPTETLTQLSSATVQWVPYSQPDQLQTIRWKGILRQGEMQRVTGRIESSQKQMLRLRFGNQTLDSIVLREGDNTFALQFAAFAQGHSQTELVLGTSRLGGTLLDTVRFFTRQAEPLTVRFLLNNPDFESKTLADWLGKQGHTVQLTATLSKQISSNVSFNKQDKSAVKTVPDLIITEPPNATNPAIRKAITDGKAVLFINLTDPEADCRIINRALGSKWQVRRASNEAAISIGNGLNALPYRFADNLNQFAVSGYPVAVQQIAGHGFAGRVAISLLSETYPLSLSGDSVAYNRIWSAVLARLTRSGNNTVLVDAPLYPGLQQALWVNNPINRIRTMNVGQDTLSFAYSPINERSAKAMSSFGQPGWQIVQDSLALYVEEATPSLRDRQVVSRFMLAHSQDEALRSPSRRTTTVQLPNWVWLLMFIACFTTLWIEPKVH